ncbi:fibrinogen C domain-containing protein 1-like [Uranotaenia lowii]|uniref:fibrinogen C domain-containing protein 1-like n=1 Tax=Uranotaenia lowii TaxID=190385 RepID=UPI002479D956|nr:fibrinogen C domain-containing protein 1-like [Uranotaenia lowii]
MRTFIALAIALLCVHAEASGNKPVWPVVPKSCVNVNVTGIYLINPHRGFGQPYEVYCEQDWVSGGENSAPGWSWEGGWIVIQRRMDGWTHFNRNWEAYENGFGDIEGEFWLGLKKIHQLTYGQRWELRIVLEDVQGLVKEARYSDFVVGESSDAYRLKSVGNYTGTAGDSLSGLVEMPFSTNDVDNDLVPEFNCAEKYLGGWWHRSCHDSNLNGWYVKEIKPEWKCGMVVCWKGLGWPYSPLKNVRMMIRPWKRNWPVVPHWTDL